MAFSQGSRASLAYKTESTFGITVDGDFKNLPFSTHSLSLTKDSLAGTDMQPDRMTRVNRAGNRQVGGDIVVDLRDSDFDEFLESAMLNVFPAAGSNPQRMKIGTTRKFLTIEDVAEDINVRRQFGGCTVSSMAISLAPNQMVTTTFGMVGKDMNPLLEAGSFIEDEVYTIVSVGPTATVTDFTVFGADNNNIGTTFTCDANAQTGTGTARVATNGKRVHAASTGASPFDAYSGDISIGTVGSPATSAIVTSIDFTLDNTMAATFVIGSDSAPSIEAGRAEVEGTLTAYFENSDLIDRFLTETKTAIRVSVDDETLVNPYIFDFPSVKITSADVGVDGPASRMVTMSFVALYDASAGGLATNFMITRPDVPA